MSRIRRACVGSIYSLENTQQFLKIMGYCLFTLLILLSFYAAAEASHCATNGLPILRNISEIGQDDYGRPGLSHTTIAGAVMHGFKEVWNTNGLEDLQFLVIISRPPIKVFIYDDWSMPHTAAKLQFPYYWDEKCYQTPSNKDEL